MFDSRKVGRQMAELRKRRGFTQEELAERLGVTPQAVSKWENGHAMPEVSLLLELSEALESTIDDILLKKSVPPLQGNYEYRLIPYAPIAEFSGRKWPRSMGRAALISALKLFMGLEEHRDRQGRQINDDSEYILQAAYSGVTFGYSHAGEDLFSVYGLTAEKHRSGEDPEEALVGTAVRHIMGGYPVIVYPKEYRDMVLAVGFADGGRTLLGLPFLDGDDEKNSVMSFEKLQRFPKWYLEDIELMLIKPSEQVVSVEQACRQALRNGYEMLSNRDHAGDKPLFGYGLVIYDNWCELLNQENQQGRIEIECVYPHIFIHYEGKLRIRQFLELCLHTIEGIDGEAVQKAIGLYQEIFDLCEKHIPRLVTEHPKDVWAVKSIRQWFIQMLRRSKELEEEALVCLEQAMKSIE